MKAPVRRAKLHVKKGDVVLVLTGNDKGKQGVIREAYPREQRVLVEGVNLRWKHKKPTAQSQKGERIQEERSIHASNVRRVDGAAKSTSATKSASAAKSTKKAAK